MQDTATCVSCETLTDGGELGHATNNDERMRRWICPKAPGPLDERLGLVGRGVIS